MMQSAQSKVTHDTSKRSIYSTSDPTSHRRGLAVSELRKPIKDRKEEWKPENIRNPSAGSIFNYFPVAKQKKQQSDDVPSKLKGDDRSNQRLEAYCHCETFPRGPTPSLLLPRHIYIDWQSREDMGQQGFHGSSP
ncbi:hypothetical protein HZ326_19040 [Fusarium oxysporum f. sp. albedinis]|nr:hypothetical protein HZ326_19040 [Fusarium oxysporum f. sp. albedinis]